MQAFFGSAFGTPVNVDVSLSGTGDRRYRDAVAVGTGLPQRQYIYSTGDDIVGDVKVGVVGGRRLEHLGVKIELKGVVDISNDKGGHSHEFVSVVRELAAPGSLTGLQSFSFKFAKADLPHETYDGAHAVCRYFLRASVGRTATAAHAVRETEFLVQSLPQQSSALVAASAPASSSSALAAPSAGPLAASSLADSSVKLEVGIEDCLHIEFEYDATRLALDDDVTGRVHFLLVRIRIRTMELALVRRETVGAAGGGGAGSGSAGLPESETLTRFELMDGCPVRGEVIPIRMPLAGLDLTPTFSVDVAGGGGAAGGASTFFSVRYFLNLVLLDDEDRRYFKSQELWLHRRQLDAGTAPAGSAPGTGGV